MRYRENQDSILKLTPSNPASPPDVRYRENQDSILKLDSIQSGFAAGCEARLRLAVGLIFAWAMPMVRPLAAKPLGQSPNQGRSPPEYLRLTARPEPRLTSGGEAGVGGVKFRIGA